MQIPSKLFLNNFFFFLNFYLELIRRFPLPPTPPPLGLDQGGGPLLDIDLMGVLAHTTGNSERYNIIAHKKFPKKSNFKKN